MRLRHYPIEPTPAPRQSRRDSWDPSKAVQAYRAFRDEVAWRKLELYEPFFHVVFLIPVFPSWWAKKQRDHYGQPHESKPDADNLAKALIDAVHRHDDDAHRWTYATSKLWSPSPGIVVSDTFLPLHDELPVDLPKLLEACRD